METEKPIGKLIREVHARSGMKLKVFAERIGTTRQNVYKIFDKSAISTARLQKISEVLEYDFFEHFRLRAPRSADPNDPRKPDPDFRYAELRRELESARARVRLLEERLADKERIIELLRSR